MSVGRDQSILVYDIGGNHIAAGVYCTANDSLESVVSAPLPEAETAEAFIEELYGLGNLATASRSHIDGIELAFPGPFDFSSGISRMRHKLTCIYGVNLRVPLAQRFGCDPACVGFLNDASAFLLGEIRSGAAKGHRRVVGLTLGTGIGSAFALNGRIVTTGAGVPEGGEIWNLPFRAGIVEDAISSSAIRREYENRTGTVREVVELAARVTDDAAASAAFDEFGRNLGQVVRQTFAGFAPDVVVLGGGICRSAELFLPAVERQLNEPAFSFRVSTLFERAALVGAAAAWLSRSEKVGRLSAMRVNRMARTENSIETEIPC